MPVAIGTIKAEIEKHNLDRADVLLILNVVKKRIDNIDSVVELARQKADDELKLAKEKHKATLNKVEIKAIQSEIEATMKFLEIQANQKEEAKEEIKDEVE